MSCKHSDYFGLFQGLRKYFQGFCIKIVEFLIRLPWLLKLPIDRLGIILTIRYLFGAIRGMSFLSVISVRTVRTEIM